MSPDPRFPARPRARKARAFALGGAVLLVAGGVLLYGAISVRAAEEFTHARRVAPPATPTVRGRYEDVSFRTVDGLTLRGWFFPAAGDRAAIVVHGKDTMRTENNDRSERIAEFLLANGYAVLLFDLRGHGVSDGDRFSLGEYERLDVAAAIDLLVARGYAPARIALLGISMGAGTVLQTLLVRPDVGPVIADSSYTDAATLVAEDLGSATGLAPWFTPGILLASRLLFGIDADRIRPIDVVRGHPERAFLFIHCAEDTLVLPHHGAELRAASAHPASELWMAPGCHHVEAVDRYPDEYARRVLAFLAANMR